MATFCPCASLNLINIHRFVVKGQVWELGYECFVCAYVCRLSNSVTSGVVHLFLYVFQQTLTADNVEEVADRVSNIVQTTEDQSSENLQAVTDVLSNTVNLLGNISVSAEVIRDCFCSNHFVSKCAIHPPPTFLWFHEVPCVTAHHVKSSLNMQVWQLISNSSFASHSNSIVTELVLAHNLMQLNLVSQFPSLRFWPFSLQKSHQQYKGPVLLSLSLILALGWFKVYYITALQVDLVIGSGNLYINLIVQAKLPSKCSSPLSHHGHLLRKVHNCTVHFFNAGLTITT